MLSHLTHRKPKHHKYQFYQEWFDFTKYNWTIQDNDNTLYPMPLVLVNNQVMLFALV